MALAVSGLTPLCRQPLVPFTVSLPAFTKGYILPQVKCKYCTSVIVLILYVHHVDRCFHHVYMLSRTHMFAPCTKSFHDSFQVFASDLAPLKCVVLKLQTLPSVTLYSSSAIHVQKCLIEKCKKRIVSGICQSIYSFFFFFH